MTDLTDAEINALRETLDDLRSGRLNETRLFGTVHRM